MSRILVIGALCFFFKLSASEKPDILTFFDLLKNQDYISAKAHAEGIGDDQFKSSLVYLSEILMYQKNSQRPIFVDKNDELELQFVKRLILGYQHTYTSRQSSLEAYKEFSEALKLSDEIGNNVLTKAALISLLDLFRIEIFIGSKQYAPFLERFEELKSDTTDEALIIIYSLIFYSKAGDSQEIDTQYYNFLEKLDSIFEIIPKSHNFYPRYYFEKGIQYKGKENKKSAIFFMKSDSLTALRGYLKPLRGTIAWQLSLLYMQNDEIQKSKNYLEISKSLSSKLRDTFYNDRLNSLILEKEKRFDSAYHYLRKSVDIEYKLGYKNNTLESSILTVQNQTDKLKLDKLELDAENRKNKNWAIALGLLLLFGSVITFFTHNNTKRKQLLAEQEKVLQEQKVENLLKDQELNTIDAMIEGQEKERIRIANDLHDDLGGLMANVKLHFNSLEGKNKKNDSELFDKTNSLLDEAYEKIRAIAHAKNSGVIAKQGLLRAVHEMADKISIANKINIDVIDHGLDNRLENSLELTLFRMIQELITNVIKHAYASEATIHLTNHDDLLNIMVEDNGMGFKPDEIISKSDGMGLKNIDKRVAHLNGTLDIESRPEKGTTVIIDIPI